VGEKDKQTTLASKKGTGSGSREKGRGAGSYLRVLLLRPKGTLAQSAQKGAENLETGHLKGRKVKIRGVEKGRIRLIWFRMCFGGEKNSKTKGRGGGKIRNGEKK